MPPNRLLPLLVCAVCLLLATVPGPGSGQAHAQILKIPHPDTTAGNFFGVAVSIDGGRALVGASAEEVCGPNAGAAYVFERNPDDGTWAETARLVPTLCLPDNFFGRSLELDGDRAIIAASGRFGSISAPNAAYIFERDPESGTWKQVEKLIASEEHTEGSFAASVALDGDRALVTTSGDPVDGRYGGAAYVYERNPASGAWLQTARLTGSGGVRAGIFGGAADLDGDRIVVTASSYFDERPGSVYLFERDPATGVWVETERLEGVRDFFIAVALDGDRLLVGESKKGRRQSGAATLYERTAAGAWRRAATLHPRTPYKLGGFGSAVALDGDQALVVGYDEQLGMDFNIDRVVYVFGRDQATGTWAQTRIYDIGEVAFGTSIAMDGHLALIGQASENQAGAAYIVDLPGF